MLWDAGSKALSPYYVIKGVDWINIVPVCRSCCYILVVAPPGVRLIPSQNVRLMFSVPVVAHAQSHCLDPSGYSLNTLGGRSQRESGEQQGASQLVCTQSKFSIGIVPVFLPDV